MPYFDCYFTTCCCFLAFRKEGNRGNSTLHLGNIVMLESMEEIDARHRKELKALEGAKRAALKKAKGTKGKKAKEDVST